MVKFIVLLLIALLLLFLAFRGISIKAMMDDIVKAKLSWVFLSFFLSFVALISRAIRWNLLIEPLGYQPPARKTMYALMTGYLANLAFPRLGEVTRCGSLSKSENIPFNKLLGTVIAERVIDVISLLVCLLITAIIEMDRLGDFLQSSILQPILQKLASLFSSPFVTGLTIAVVLLMIAGIFYLIKKRPAKKTPGWTSIIKGMIDGVHSVRKLKRPGLFIFHSIFIWVLYYFSVYVALFAFPFSEHLGAGAALFLLVAGGFAMSAPVQGGIGAYHLLVSQGLVLYGLAQQDGLTFATLLHSLQIILILLFGSLSLLLLFLDNRKKATAEREKSGDL